MKKFLLGMSVAFLCIGTISCSSHRYMVTQPQTGKFSSYEIIEVEKFSTNVQSEKAKNLAAEFPTKLAAKLNDAFREEKIIHFREITTSSVAQNTGVLEIQGKVLSLEEGSRAKRYLLGFGAGKAYTTVECSFVDKTSNKLVSKAQFDGELSMGLFGGSSEEATQGVLDAIVDYIKENY